MVRNRNRDRDRDRDRDRGRGRDRDARSHSRSRSRDRGGRSKGGTGDADKSVGDHRRADSRDRSRSRDRGRDRGRRDYSRSRSRSRSRDRDRVRDRDRDRDRDPPAKGGKDNKDKNKANAGTKDKAKAKPEKQQSAQAKKSKPAEASSLLSFRPVPVKNSRDAQADYAELEQRIENLVATINLPSPLCDPALHLVKDFILDEKYDEVLAKRHPHVPRAARRAPSSTSTLRKITAAPSIAVDETADVNEDKMAAAGDEEAAEASMEMDDLYGDDLYGGLAGEEDDEIAADMDDGDARGDDVQQVKEEGWGKTAVSDDVGQFSGPMLFTEPATLYDKQEMSYARLQLMMRAQQGKGGHDKLIAKVKQILN